MKPHSHAPGIPLLSLCLITALTSGCSDKAATSLDSAEIYNPWDLHDLVGVANMDDDDENGEHSGCSRYWDWISSQRPLSTSRRTQ